MRNAVMALQAGLPAELSDALCRAVWRRGVAASLNACCQALELESHVLIPEPPASINHEHRGLSLQLVQPHAGEVDVLSGLRRGAARRGQVI